MGLFPRLGGPARERCCRSGERRPRHPQSRTTRTKRGRRRDSAADACWAWP